MQVKIEVNAEMMEAFLDTAEQGLSYTDYEKWKVYLAAMRCTLREAVIKETERRDNRALMLGVKI